MNPTLILMIRNHAKHGETILGNRWLPFIENLREELSQHGVEHPLSNDAQLVFTFTGHGTAFSALFTSLEHSKQAYHWPKASGQVPIQFIVDLLDSKTPLTEASLADKSLWDEIQQETIYLGAQLQSTWQDFAAQQNFPSHKLSKDSSGLAKIIFANQDIGKQQPLMAFRSLPVSPKGPECFYCGMTTHFPSQCPSKMLGMDSWALDEVGYLNFQELNILYKKVFPVRPDIIAKLSEGVKTVNLRKDKELLVFVAFFDLSVIFQLRFLWNYSFSAYSKWNTIYKTDKIKIDNHNLHMGFDCLRVGQYEQAEELLQNELKRHEGHKFAAHMGLALLALEGDRNADMGRYLEAARNHAKNSTEIIYVNLVLSRYFEIIQDFWSAKEAVNNALKADYDCLDVQYRRIQLNARENNITDRELKQLRSLLLGQKDIFIRSLLDPALLSIQGLLNEALTKQYKVIALDASQNLKGSAIEVQKLSIWLDAGDKRKKENSQSIDELRTQLAEKSYFHLLDVSEKANGLFFTCRRLRKDKTDQFTAELDLYHKKLNIFLNFWKAYPYKKFNNTFHSTIIEALNNCRKSTNLLKENSEAATKKAIELSREVKTEYDDTKRDYARLLLIRTIMNGLKIFVKKFLICESIGLLIILLAFPSISATLVHTPSFDWLVQLTTDSGVQKRTILLTAIFIAPFIALSWTLVELQKNNT